MKDGFPLLTTKKMPFKTIVTELLWFLRGDTNIKYLVDNGCNIWNGDAYKNYCKNIGKEVINQGDTFLDNKRNIIAVCKRKEIGTSKKIPILICEYEGCYIEEDCKKILTQEEFIDKIKTDDEFVKKWGELGPIYGKQWRSWYGGIGLDDDEYNVDQIQNLINDLKTNPDSRRLMVNAWNCSELDQMVLPPCHYGFQVYTRELSRKERNKWVYENIPLYHNKFENDVMIHEMLGMDDADFNVLFSIAPTRAISLMWNQRSVDTFLGLPFNIASYGLLLEIIAKEVNMVPDQLIGNLGDVHLYSNHIEQAKEQIGRELTFDEFWDSLTKKQKGSMEKPYEGETYNSVDSRIEAKNIIAEVHNIPKHTREPFPLPTLKLPDYDMFEGEFCPEYWLPEDFKIDNYQSHPAIKAPLSN
jgi:thymidylate synthase